MELNMAVDQIINNAVLVGQEGGEGRSLPVVNNWDVGG